MKLTVDIIEDFINSWVLTQQIYSVKKDITGTNNILSVVDPSGCEKPKTFHARKGMFLTVEGTQYEILAVVNNESITIKGLLTFKGKKPDKLFYTLKNPFYFHGTPMMTNSHINGAKDEEKNPMVYLYEILKEKDKSLNSSIARESDLRLFFLDNANFSDWTTDDHYSKRIVGLNNLVDTFIEKARDYTCCFYLFETDFTRINHIKWGVWRNNSGAEESLFDDQLTGVELSFTLPLKRKLN